MRITSAIHPDDDCPEFHLSDVPLGPAPRRATKDELRHIERYLFEPGYAMACLFLLDQKAAKHRAEIERAQRATGR